MLEPPRTSRGLSGEDPRRLQNGLLAQRSHPCPDGRHPPNDHRHHSAAPLAAALGAPRAAAAFLAALNASFATTSFDAALVAASVIAAALAAASVSAASFGAALAAAHEPVPFAADDS